MSDYLDEGYDNLLNYGGDDEIEIGSGDDDDDEEDSDSSSTTVSIGTDSSSSLSNSVTDSVDPSDIDSGDIISALTIASDAYIKGGADDYNDGIGFWLGYRKSYADYAFFIGNSAGDKLTYNPTDGLDITGTVTAGTLIGGSIHIPDQDTTANSFHTNSTGNSWWGCTETNFNTNNENAIAYIKSDGTVKLSSGKVGGWNINSTSIYTGTEDYSGYTANAGDITIYSNGSDASIHAKNFYIDSSGILNCTSAVISGGITTTAGSSIDGSYLTAASISSISVNLALRGWEQTCVFTVTDADTISWGAGILTDSGGTAYSISAGNTGNMTAKTYIYLDIAVSITAYQVTSTATTAVGNGKVLIAIAQNGTVEATFMLLNDNSYNINAANIVAGSITANEIATNTITADRLSVTSLSAITADLGTITSGTITGATIQTSALANTGIKFDTTSLRGYNGVGTETFTLNPSTGALTATSATITGAVTANTGYLGGATGWVVSTNYIKDVAGVVGLSAAVTAGDDIRFWAGHATPASAPFYVTEAGALVATSATISGSISTTSATIGKWTVNSTSIYTGTEDHSGYTANAGDITIYSDGSDASIHAKNFYIDTGGNLYCTSATVSGGITTTTGSSLDGQYLGAGTVTSVAANLALRGWTQTCVFSVSDLDTVAWGAGVFTASDGTSYSIGAGNTGDMAARTYIYLDIAVSTSAYQVTTTATTAVGNGKVLIATALNGTIEPTFEVFCGVGGSNINASQIVAGSITANEIATTTITADRMNVTSLSAIAADLGTITAGVIGAGTATIGGFSIGSDYIQDTASSFGLASTVTAGDDVRFWAGSTFANRASAPFRATESGIITATKIIQLSSNPYFQGNTSDGLTPTLDGGCTVNRYVEDTRLSTNASAGSCVSLARLGTMFSGGSLGALVYNFDNSAYFSAQIFLNQTTFQRAFWGLGLSSKLATPDLSDTVVETDRHIGFIVINETLYASNADNTDQTYTDVSAGITLTNYNAYSIEYTAATSIKFFVNGTLVATHTTNIPSGSTNFAMGFAIESGGGAATYLVVANNYQLYMTN